MKIQVNLTVCDDDLGRFRDRDDLSRWLVGFDGVELMLLPPNPYDHLDAHDLLGASKVIGLHLPYQPTWYDFWRGNDRELLDEFGSWEQVEARFGSRDPYVLVEQVREALGWAHAWGAEYVVYHVAESRSGELFTGRYERDNIDVCDAAAEILNEAFAAEDGTLALLMENLWESGLTFTEPTVTRRLLDAVRYPNKGLILDMGHLLHTNWRLRTLGEAASYVGAMVDAHERAGLLPWVRGVHLQASLTGELRARVARRPPVLSRDAGVRAGELFEYSFQMDRHEPFDTPEIDAVIAQLPIEYLTFEFITRNRAEHERYVARQRDALEGTIRSTGHATPDDLRRWRRSARLRAGGGVSCG